MDVFIQVLQGCVTGSRKLHVLCKMYFSCLILYNSLLVEAIYILVLCPIPFAKRPFIYKFCVLFHSATDHLYTSVVSYSFQEEAICIQVLCPIPFSKMPFIYSVVFYSILQQTIYIQVLCSIPFCKRLLIYECCVLYSFLQKAIYI